MTISGRNIDFSYEVPFIWKKLSDKIGTENKIFNLFFYNLLSEKQIQEICNSIASIEKPLEEVNLETNKLLKPEMFLSKEEKILEKWSKIKPEPYYKEKIALNILITLLGLIYLGSMVSNEIFIAFFIIWLLIISIYVISSLLIVNRTLLVTNYRVLYLHQRIPKLLSYLFGKMPVWKLTEVSKEHVEVLNHKIFIPKTNMKKIVFMLLITLTSFAVIFNQNQIYLSSVFEPVVVDIFLILTFMCLILSTISIIEEMVKSIPRFGLQLIMKNGRIEIPYFYNPGSLNKIHEVVNT